MYGVITTVPAPVAMYDGMHAEMTRRTGTSVDGLLVHVGRATPGRVRGAGGVGVQGALRPRQRRDRLPPDAGTGGRPTWRPPIEQATEAFEVHGLVIPRGDILI